MRKVPCRGVLWDILEIQLGILYTVVIDGFKHIYGAWGAVPSLVPGWRRDAWCVPGDVPRYLRTTAVRLRWR